MFLQVIIQKKSDSSVVAIENTVEGASSYSDSDYNKICWDRDMDGDFPDIESTFTDNRTTMRKRCAHYCVELDHLTQRWRGQVDIDGASEETPLSGTITFDNGYADISASGGAFTSELAVGDYIQLDADAYPYKIITITDDNNAVLTENYAHTGGSGAASKVLTEKAEAVRKRQEIKDKYP